MLRGRRLYLLPLLLIGILGITLSTLGWQKRQERLKDRTLAETRRILETSQHSFDLISQIFYNVRNDELSRTLHEIEVEHPDREEQKILKERLLGRLITLYHNLQLLGLVQFQLYRPDGTLFLRFEEVGNQDRGSASVRATLLKLQHQYRFLKGFEVGRFTEGLRYIYPLFYDGKFVGSYEWVWSSEALVRQAMKNSPGLYGILLDSSTLRQRMEPALLATEYRLLPSCHDYAYRRTLHGSYHSRLFPLLRKLSLCSLRESDTDRFSALSFQGKNYLATILRLRTLDGAPYGSFVRIVESNGMAQLFRDYLIELGSILLSLLLLSLLFYRIDREKRFTRTLLDSQPSLIMLTDGKRLFNANKAFLDFFGVSDAREFSRQYGCICNCFLEVDGFLRKNPENTDWLEYLIRHRDVEHRVIMYDQHRDENRIFGVRIQPFEGGRLSVVTFQDVTEMEKERKRFQREAMIDHLTGIYNRRAYQDFLADRIRTLRIYRHSDVYLVMFDIDDFKKINDLYGHQRGDAVLEELSSLIRSHIRKSDFFARWGGDEFVILMEGISHDEVRRTVSHLRRIVHEHDFYLQHPLHCSFGITQIHETDSVSSATERADASLYQAKLRGKDRIVLWEDLRQD